MESHFTTPMPTSSADEDILPPDQKSGAEIPTLKDICLRYITKNVKKLDHILGQFFNGQSTMLLDTQLLVQVLLSSVHYLTVDFIRQLENALPALILESESDLIWKKKLLKQYSIRDIPAPFHELVTDVKAQLAALVSKDTSLAEKNNILKFLSTIPFSNELARETDVALIVNTIRKDNTLPLSIIALAAEITAKWKKIFKNQQRREPSSSSNADPCGSCGDVGLDSVGILTWRQLFQYHEKKEHIMVEKGAKRFSEMSTSERDKRKTSLSADSSDMSKNKKRKLQKILSAGSRVDPSRAQATLFRPGRSAVGNHVLQSVKSSKGHSAVDLMQARGVHSTKKMKVVTTSSGGVMQIPRCVLQKNK